MAETCLWMTTQKYIFGISLGKLMELGKDEVVDFESISSPPFDFHLKLPESCMSPFVFNSKIFLAGGSHKFYQLFLEDVNDNKLSVSEAASYSIPPPPTPLYRSFIANIVGEVYLFVYDGGYVREQALRDEGLWVLRSGQWQALPDPPPLDKYDDDGYSYYHSGRRFVHQDKLFFEATSKELHLYVFDPRAVTWTEVEDNIKNSFALWLCYYLHFPSIAVSLPDVCNCRVTLFWTTEKRAPDPYHDRVGPLKIYAMLVNNQNNSVHSYQSLDECSNAIKPIISFHTSNVEFVDLGNGLVCALVSGRVLEYSRSQLLCVLVFALSLAQDFDNDAPGKEKRFLSVDRVLVNSVFSMQDYDEDYSSEEVQHALIFPPMEELPPQTCLHTPKV